MQKLFLLLSGVIAATNGLMTQRLVVRPTIRHAHVSRGHPALPRSPTVARPVVSRASIAPQRRSAVIMRQQSMPAGLFGAVSSVRPARSRMLRLLVAVATALQSLLAFLALSTSKAFAAERTASPIVLSSNVVKWGGFLILVGAVQFFSGKEDPIIVETEVEDEHVKPDAGASASSSKTMERSETSSFDVADDSAYMDSFRRRMQELAEAKDNANADADAAPAVADATADSTDSWGKGSTAVLEPPSEAGTSATRGNGEGEEEMPDFPIGFPLREEDLEGNTEAAADAQKVAMLERMFGTRSD